VCGRIRLPVFGLIVAKRKRRGNVALAGPSEPPVRPGLVSAGRMVPADIARPPYAATGDPGPSRSPLVRTPAEVASMRRAGIAAAEILLIATERVEVGMTSDQIDAIVHEATIERDGYPSPLGYRGFPKSTCTSVNEVICHGIPDSRPLLDGDIVNIDVTIYLDGVHGDTSATVLVGDVDAASHALVINTRDAMYEGIAAVRDGAVINGIGRAIERHAKMHSLGVVREFIGHGIGTEFHSGLQIPHYYDRRATMPIESGMTFTVEPMLTLGSPAIQLWNDDWTAVTADGSRTAQFEHTLIATDDGSDILTKTPAGECAADLIA
jgi:methionyl aminopeptidase